MSDPTLHSVETVPAQSVRRGRTRRPVARETAIDLLQVTTRLSETEARVLAQSRQVLLKLPAGRSAAGLTSPALVREYLITLLGSQEREFFAMVALDNRHRVLGSEILFAGTIDGSRVYPREVVKSALRSNAAAVIFAHNHPSGVLEPSQADELITRRLKDALSLVDIRVLDHFVIGGGDAFSFCERGL